MAGHSKWANIKQLTQTGIRAFDNDMNAITQMSNGFGGWLLHRVNKITKSMVI